MTSKKTCNERLIISMNKKILTFPLLFTLSSLFLSTSIPIYTKSIATTAKPKAPAVKTTAPTIVKPATPAAQTPQAPYTQELKALKSIPTNVITAWNSLHAQYLQASSNSNSTSALTTAALDHFMPLFNTNLFTLMHNQCQPTTFPKLLNDPQGTIHTAYAVTHLAQTCARLASICSIQNINNKPTVQFAGDNRDMGIIVNILNNSNAEFSINQTSTNGSNAVPIGLISHGLNEVNLHTAALQTPASTSTKTPTASTQMFELQELNAQNPTTIKLAMMLGSELITFLESLPRKDKKTVEMNGLPTSSEFLAEPADWYFVLIQNPTASTASTPNPDQRIQAINVSKLSGPYLLTMQINPFTINLPATDTAAASTMDIFQPSISYVHTLATKALSSENLPLIILPQFLWNLPDLQALWMLQITTYLATLTDFKLFGPTTFANAYQYFSNLGFFENKNSKTFCIDRYNTLPIGSFPFDAQMLIGAAIYETNCNYCSDLQQIYSCENSHQQLISNDPICFYTNCQIILNPEKTQQINLQLIEKASFFEIYKNLKNNQQRLLFPLPASEMQQGVFSEFIEEKQGEYKIIWSNKESQILNIQYFFTKTKLSTIEIAFVNEHKNWEGTIVPKELLNLTPGIKNNFKVTYELLSNKNQYELIINPTSPIDKHQLVYTIHTSKLPITDLSYDLYETFKGENFTHCNIIQNGAFPSFLANLTKNDWQNGIYLITSINNQNHLNAKDTGSLTVSFYKSNKVLLGNITSQGLYKNNPNMPGIRHFVQTSTIHSNAFKPLFNIFLSTAVFIKDPN